MDGLIPYDIVYRSSEDKRFSVAELGNGLPTPERGREQLSSGKVHNQMPIQHSGGRVKGWQSARNAPMPQEIVLRFPGNVVLTHLRVLSHESKIMSRMEVRFYALDENCEAGGPETPSFRAVRFLKLGSVTFSNNEHTSYRSKERKTVHLKVTAYFLKLLLHEPHQNVLNHFKQVGVYSIECYGRVVTRVPRHVDQAIVSSGTLLFVPSGRESSNCTSNSMKLPPIQPHHHIYVQQLTQDQERHDDAELSHFTMPFGDAISQEAAMPAFRSVRILEFEDFFVRRSTELLTLKNQAVGMEDFDTAKVCQDRMKLMNRRSKRIYRAEQEKVQAIIDEDFDAAKKAKFQMDAMIEKVYNDVQVPQLRQVHDELGCSGDSFNEDKLRNEQGSEVASSAYEAGRDVVVGADSGEAAGSEERKAKEGWELAMEDDLPHPDGAPDDKGVFFALNDGDDSSRFDISSSDRDTSQPLGSQHISQQKDVAELKGENVSLDSRECGLVGKNNNGDQFNEDNIRGMTAPTLFERLQPWEEEVAREIMKVSGQCDMPDMSEISMKKFAEVLSLSSVVGAFTTACLYSTNFKLRESTLGVIASKMTTLYTSSPAAIVEGVLRFLDLNGYGLQDHIPAVANAACAFLRKVLTEGGELLEEVLAPVVNLLPRLLCCAADYNPRLREEAMATLAMFVKRPEVGKAAVLSALLAEPIDKDRRRIQMLMHGRSSCGSRCCRTLLAKAGFSCAVQEEVPVNTLITRGPRLLRPCLIIKTGRDLAVSTVSSLISREKFVMTEKRICGIDNVSIREQFRAIIECTKAQKSGQLQHTPDAMVASSPLSAEQRTPYRKGGRTPAKAYKRTMTTRGQ
uniref:Centrosomal protein CEP104 N-terminal domain-containing protein n=1 Tax=Trypanosoma congolense (strain IL3000) TaxID=1068625 RepID=G0UM54_TRYCI|nr:conserved hypothetical protein [Trypanosoma congolense IL3000]